jgi:hypothetical protein
MSTGLGQGVHDQLHRLPGMPAHAQAERLNANAAARARNGNSHGRRGHGPSSANRRAALRSPNAHHANPPRVLVSWQQWIGGLFGQSRG